jgi:trehalose synthase
MIKRNLKAYEEVAGKIAISQLRQLADSLAGSKVVHVNSTKAGGGVAEILDWMVPLMNDLGMDASWEVIQGYDKYFEVTKTFHNAMQGNPSVLTQKMIDTYESTVADNAQRLRPVLEDADFVFIHDPQPAALLDLCPNRKGKWVWRCHIDSSKPVRKVWKYLKSKVQNYDASIFSLKNFAQPLPHPQFIIAPSIDPLSPKNEELNSPEITSTFAEYGIPNNGIPVLTQVSRFDRFKDPIGVIEAFNTLTEHIRAELVLAGGGATDDPEGQMVLEEVRDAAKDNPHIHVLMLPNDAHHTINALQRGSTIVIQKSLQEGFGLTVTEALWKEKPVIGGNVGGIKLQVQDYYTGFLVETPDGAALRIRELLHDPKKMERMGKIARYFVKENFLLTRHLREYLTLMLGLGRGLTDYVLAESSDQED